MHFLDAKGYAVRKRDMWREWDEWQRFASICVVDNLARLLDRRKSVVIIRWKTAGKEVYAVELSKEGLLHQFNLSLVFLGVQSDVET